jgi:plasmid stabilization system protein ParE
MSVQFTLAPQAALDLFEIWEYIKDQASVTTADHVESAIRERIAFFGGIPQGRTLPQRLDGRGREVFPGLLLFDRLSTHDKTAANRFHSARTPGRDRTPQKPFVKGSAR